MKLVGASRAYIRGPFMVEGLLQGLIGSAAGLAVLFLATQLARRYLATQTGQILHQLDLAFLPPSWTVSLLGGGLLVGLGGAAISLNQFLKEHISYQ
jgi:cell division transport system permease protein